MKRSVLLICLSMLLPSLAAIAQETGRLDVTVQRAASMGSLAGPIVGAKVIVVHWTGAGGHPSLVQDQTANTNEMGTCTINLPPGTYDIFIASSELAPTAFRRSITAGGTVTLTATLRAAGSHFRPVE